MGTTVLVTLFFGLLGLIPATMHSNRAGRIGVPTNRYWKAFGWTLAAEALIVVVLIGSVFLGVFGSVNGATTARSVSSSAEGLTQSVPDVGSQVPSEPTNEVSSASPSADALETAGATIVLPSAARICAESSGVGPHAASAAGNAKTSCPFAESVRSGYDSSGAGGTSVIVDAFSPVTEKWYTVQCDGEAPVTCTGMAGFDILIFIYSSDAEVLRSG